ncbi:hypothetical protein J7963_19235 [Vibrio parahaemolyticus]|nr:hypothetical protein [Vibrio parahaemolyticus]
MKTAVYICTNEQHVPLGHIFMSSWEAKSTNEVDFYWFVDDESLIAELKQEYPSITEILLTDRTQRENNTHFPDSFFYGMSLKIFALRHFIGKYDRVVYFDVDTIVNKDPAELLNFDLKGKLVAAAPDIPARRWPLDKSLPPHLNDEFERRGDLCSDPINYVNSGVMVFDMAKISDLPEHDSLADSMNFVLTDQDYINHVFDGQITLLPDTFNYMVDQSYCQWMTLNQRLEANMAMGEAVIQHFHGQAKPWMNDVASLSLIASQMHTESFWTHCDAIQARLGDSWVSIEAEKNKEMFDLFMRRAKSLSI